MTLKECVEAIVVYVEDHIHDTLSADIISEKIGYSKFYLSRIFPVYTGLNLMAYVRKRKLNHALIDLQKEMRIIDIAISYGYGSERAFSRAFANEFGKSPSYFRNNSYKIKCSQQVYDVHLPRREWITMIKDYLSDITYETIKDMKVISGIKIGLEPEDEIINEMMQYKDDMKIKIDRSFGFDSPVEEKRASIGERGYEFWLAVNADVSLENTDYILKSVPSYKYAKLRITDPFENPMEKIPNAWKTLVTWIEDNQVISKSDTNEQLDCLEEVLDIDGMTYMDIMIPIEKI